MERASPSPHRPNNSSNPHPSQGLCKRNIAAKTAPSTPGGSRGRVGVINDALTLSHMPLSVPGNSSNNHPRIVKSRYRGKRPELSCSGLCLWPHRAYRGEMGGGQK